MSRSDCTRRPLHLLPRLSAAVRLSTSALGRRRPVVSSIRSLQYPAPSALPAAARLPFFLFSRLVRVPTLLCQLVHLLLQPSTQQHPSPPSTTALRAALHWQRLQPTRRNRAVSCRPLLCTSMPSLRLFFTHVFFSISFASALCAAFAVSDHAAASAACSGTLAVSERLGLQRHAATFM